VTSRTPSKMIFSRAGSFRLAADSVLIVPLAM
jgi:hypothetical protein